MILRVAVPSPLRAYFDYYPAAGRPAPRPGVRVRVPFGRGTRIGLVMEHARESELDPARLKHIIEALDPEPLVSASLLELLRWTSEYYHYPIGEVVSVALPALLRQGKPARTPTEKRWRVTEEGVRVACEGSPRGPLQAALLRRLAEAREGLSGEELAREGSTWPRALASLCDKGWVRVEEVAAAAAPEPATRAGNAAALSSSQREAVARVAEHGASFATFLLDGVTGSGKTEVYLALIADVIAKGKQALILVPEIGLTPQTLARFAESPAGRPCVLHSGLSERERLRTWLLARSGEAKVVLGTRSAVYVPLARPGIFIVDEEHDISYKQQEGLRYCARDVAVVRARQADVPVVLGSATPSLESLHNVALGRYRHLRLPYRVQGAAQPEVRVLDVRQRSFENGLCEELLAAIAENLAANEQTLLFLNRRGYAPVLMCHACGWVCDCERCDAHMVLHRVGSELRCHHCGAERAMVDACPACGSEALQGLGVGTQQVVSALAGTFPSARIARMDRDNLRRRGSLEAVLDGIRRREVDILVGTQMLAKGHHFPFVTLVSILDADGGFFSADFRAGERMAQLLVQVSGRAGRSTRPGTVLIQTHHPHHPLLRALITEGYEQFAKIALEERKTAALPPAASLALLRAEAARRAPALEFLAEARERARPYAAPGLSVQGPVPAAMERRAGRYRAQLLIEAPRRGTLHRFLSGWLPAVEAIRGARKVRWSLDVDPQEVF